MGDNRPPDDATLRWPVARGELDDLETLELARDSSGRLAWHNMAPPEQDTFREWMPRRGRGPGAQPPPEAAGDVWDDDSIGSLFASEATTPATQTFVPPAGAPPVPVVENGFDEPLLTAPMSAAAPLPADAWNDLPVAEVVAATPSPASPPTPSTASPPTADEALTERIAVRRPTPAETAPPHQATVKVSAAEETPTTVPFGPVDAAAPLRLSLAVTTTDGRRPVRISVPPMARHTRTRVERVAVLATGALIGVVVSGAFRGAWRPDARPAPDTAERRSAAPRGVGHAPPATAAVPRPQTATPAVPEAQPAAAAVPKPTSLAVVRGPSTTAVVPGPQTATPPVPEVQPATAAAPEVPPPPRDAKAAPPAPKHVAPVPIAPPAPVAVAAAPSRAAAAPAPRPAPASTTTATATRPAAAPAPIAAPPEVLETIGRFAAAYNRMDATATQAIWPAADRQALVTTFTALREQRLTLSQCRGILHGDTATVICRGTLRYRPRVGDHDTRTLEGTWRFSMLQRANDWVVDGIESP